MSADEVEQEPLKGTSECLEGVPNAELADAWLAALKAGGSPCKAFLYYNGILMFKRLQECSPS